MSCTHCKTTSGPFQSRLHINSLCRSCDKLFRERKIPVYRAIRPSKTLSFASFPFSTKHQIIGFRGRYSFTNPVLSPAIGEDDDNNNDNENREGIDDEIGEDIDDDNNGYDEDDNNDNIDEIDDNINNNGNGDGDLLPPSPEYDRSDPRLFRETPELFSPRTLLILGDMSNDRTSPRDRLSTPDPERSERVIRQQVGNIIDNLFDAQQKMRQEISSLKRSLHDANDKLKESEALVSRLRDEKEAVTTTLKRYKTCHTKVMEHMTAVENDSAAE